MNFNNEPDKLEFLVSIQAISAINCTSTLIRSQDIGNLFLDIAPLVKKKSVSMATILKILNFVCRDE